MGSTALQFAQVKQRGCQSPAIGFRIINSKEIAITISIKEEGRIYLWKDDISKYYDRLFTISCEMYWSVGKDGYFKASIDGKQVVNYKGSMGWIDSPEYYFKYGIYNPSNAKAIPDDFVLRLYHGVYCSKIETTD